MNVEIGTEAAQFPEMEYINGIIVAVHSLCVKVKVLDTQYHRAEVGMELTKKDLQEVPHGK
jgi:hypothetical protein